MASIYSLYFQNSFDHLGPSPLSQRELSLASSISVLYTIILPGCPKWLAEHLDLFLSYHPSWYLVCAPKTPLLITCNLLAAGGTVFGIVDRGSNLWSLICQLRDHQARQHWMSTPSSGGPEVSPNCFAVGSLGSLPEHCPSYLLLIFND